MDLPELPKPQEILFRTVPVSRQDVQEETRTVELAFSSEEPVDRHFGREILDHAPGSVRLDRLRKGGAVLVNHDTHDQVGVVESARIDRDKKGRAVVRFGKSVRADEIFQDVKDGIRTLVSVGYQVFQMIMEEGGDERGATFRATDWQPLEVSFVSVPADVSVGVGRNQSFPMKKESNIMKSNITIERNEDEERDEKFSDQWTTEKKERFRVSEIRGLAKLHRSCQGLEEFADRAIGNGMSLNAFRQAILENFYKAKPLNIPTSDFSGSSRGTASGMDGQDLAGFSIIRAIRGLLTKDFAACPFELDVSRTLAQRRGKPSEGLVIPMEALTLSTRTVSKGGDGGDLIGMEHRPDLFVDVLRARSLILALGAMELTGLQGDVSIPRKTAGTTAFWVAEDVAPTGSDPTFDAIQLTPKTVGGFVDFTRKMLLQSSPGIEELAREDLAATLAGALDLVAISGSGSGSQPLGLLNVTGIGDVAGGTDGAAPTWAHVCELEGLVSAANADIGRLGYLTNSQVRKKLKVTEKATNTGQFVWPDIPLKEGMSQLNGYLAGVSNNVPANLDKGTATGVCSAILYGNWGDLLVGLWGNGIDLLVDPYTGGTKGNVRVIAHMDCDVAVRHAGSFAAMQDVLTT